MTNQYARLFPDFDKTPKTVIAAIAYSFALQLCIEEGPDALEKIRAEWRMLHADKIVPQKPQSKKRVALIA